MQTTFWTDLKSFLAHTHLIAFLAGLGVGVAAAGTFAGMVALGLLGWGIGTRARRARPARGALLDHTTRPSP